MNGQLHSKHRWEEGSLTFKRTKVFLQIADFCKLLTVFLPPAVCVCMCVCVCAHARAHVLSHVWLWQLLPARLLYLFYRILQARILEWVAISSSKESSQPRDLTHTSCVSCIAGRFFTVEPLEKTTLSYSYSIDYLTHRDKCQLYE